MHNANTSNNDDNNNDDNDDTKTIISCLSRTFQEDS